MEELDFGRELRTVRLKRGITLLELATQAGVSRSALQEIEAGGECKLSTVQRILAALGARLRVSWRRR